MPRAIQKKMKADPVSMYIYRQNVCCVIKQVVKVKSGMLARGALFDNEIGFTILAPSVIIGCH